MQISFDDCLLDTDRRELRRDSRLVAIEPQVFDILVYLVENRDRVVSKDDLIASVWRGRVVSDSTLDSRINAVRKAVGDSGGEQRLVRTIARKGFRFIGEATNPVKPSNTQASSPATLHQEVHFCTASDGVRIAYALAGQGPPVVKAANWLNHLEYDWQSPIWSRLLHELAARHQLIRYDERGNGLSDGTSTIFHLRHLSAILKASSKPPDWIASRCSAFHRDARSRLSMPFVIPSASVTLFCTADLPAAGPRGMQNTHARCFPLSSKAGERKIRRFDSSSRRFSFPKARPNRCNGSTICNASRPRRKMLCALCANGDVDISDLLPQVRVPTLVLHCRNDAAVAFDEGRRLAAGIPGAKFVALESRNHLVLESEPAWEKFIGEIRAFLQS